MNDDSGSLIAGLLVLALQLGIPIGLVALGYFAGRHFERRHYASIHQREAQFLNLPAAPTKGWDTERPVAEARLVSGSVVVSIDHFKRLLAALRNIVGGRMRSYESLLDRARREAVLRMKQEFPEAHIIVNMRLETSVIGNQTRRGAITCVECFAYGTAIKYRP